MNPITDAQLIDFIYREAELIENGEELAVSHCPPLMLIRW